jgi:hypothetical protein
MKFAILPLVFVSVWASAQTSLPAFPDGAAPLSPQALEAALAGKVFSVKPASGPGWRWQINANGYFFINAGNFSDSGKWSVKDSTLCSEGQKIKANCNEVRLAAGELYLRRDSGEVVKLAVQP